MFLYIAPLLNEESKGIFTINVLSNLKEKLQETKGSVNQKIMNFRKKSKDFEGKLNPEEEANIVNILSIISKSKDKETRDFLISFLSDITELTKREIENFSKTEDF